MAGMSRGWRLAGLYAMAIGLGLASAVVALRWPWWADDIRVGPWRASAEGGSAQAGPYIRALVARIGLLALSRRETLYFVADRDSDGRSLRSRCRYRIEGTAPPARWWSITAYADDYFLFPDEQRRYSAGGHSLPAPRFVLHTGPAPAGHGAWLPTPGDRGLVLTLRLYQPEAALAADPARWAAPAIRPDGVCT